MAMKEIHDEEFKRFISIELENEKLKAENAFLHKKIVEYKIQLKDDEVIELDFLARKEIVDLNLSVRAINALHGEKIKTLADLKMFINKYSIRGLLRIRNMGKRSYDEICESIYKYL